MRAILSVAPTKSHIIAFSKLGTLLKQNNIDFSIANVSNFKSFIINQGQKFIQIESIPFGLNIDRKFTNSFGYWKDFQAQANESLYKIRLEEWRNILAKNKPDLIFVDIFQFTDILIIRAINRNLKLILVNTMLSTNFDLFLPSIQSSFKKSNLEILGNIYSVIIKKSCRIGNYFKYFGWDNYSLVKLRAKELELILDENKVFHFGFKNIQELILAPENLEFPFSKKRPNQIYLGNSSDFRKESQVEKFKFLKELKASKPSINFIFCSFGTIFKHKTPEIELFLSKLLTVVTNRSDFILVLSFSDFQKEKFSKINFQNIFIFDEVPQLFLLSFTDLFILSGGLNSIKEAIDFNVPMLIYPYGNLWDQEGNANRVEFHGLGEKGNLNKDSTKMIESKIDKLIKSNLIKKNISKFKLDKKYSIDNSELLRKLVEN